VEEATDGLAPTMATALDAWGPGDARLVATGTGLTPKGGLRRLFEGRRDAVAITLYEDPPTEGELVDMLREAGLSRIEATAREELWGLALALPPGELRGLVERLSLHQVGREEALGAATVRALAPQAGEAELDDLLRAVTDGRRDRVAPLLALMAAQGVGSVAVAIAVSRHFRSLLAVVSDPGGAQAGVAALRPPAFGVRREALLRAAGAWRREQIEDGLRSLLELDLALRSGSAAPDRALVERALLRLATLRNG
jgi:DNA polymerase-3 subunit delta